MPRRLIEEEEDPEDLAEEREEPEDLEAEEPEGLEAEDPIEIEEEKFIVQRLLDRWWRETARPYLTKNNIMATGLLALSGVGSLFITPFIALVGVGVFIQLAEEPKKQSLEAHEDIDSPPSSPRNRNNNRENDLEI